MIPAASTTIAIERNTQTDPDDDPMWTSVAIKVRAHLRASARAGNVAGQVIDAELTADPCDIKLGDRIVNETTGETFTPTTVLLHHYGFGIDSLTHVRAGLVRVHC